MISIQGKGVFAGVAMGPLYYYQRAKSVIRRIKVEDAVAEWDRFKAAQKKAIEQLGELYEKALKEAGEEAAFLFETHQMMAEDDDYVEAIQGLIKDEMMNAEAAVTDVAAQFADMFAQMEDTYMQARAADVKDVSGRIVGILTGVVQGGIDSPVPVILDADEATRTMMMAKREEQLKRQKLLEQLKGQPNVTRDGQSIKVFCNIGNPEDVPVVLSNDGGGIGLFRSEFLYLNCSDYPSEDYQFEAYKKVLSDMGGKEVVIRTLDIGADKQIDYFQMPREENPALGNRALRICLNRPEIFKTQLRALYRASAFGKLGIMFPMVTSVWEVKEAKKMCELVKKELTAEGKPFADDVQIGIMIETPAAAVMSDRLAKLVDFFSCGTNDLTQYTLACDRQNNDLGRFFNPHHPAVLRLLKMVCDNAHRNGVWVGICGELGADLELTETFLAIGIDELSVSPRSVLPLRQKIRETTIGNVKEKILADLFSDEVPL